MTNIQVIKDKMLCWRDFYGQDIGPTDAIKKATTREQLRVIMNAHVHFLESQSIDAIRDAEQFIQVLGI